ncbi:SIR2 family protein [Dyella sp.]|uniref:SIR2 family protein n=1 Tax=Dyella sp. TaxID=1869338 RepID=UPI003F7D9B32
MSSFQVNADLIDDLAKQRVVLFLGSGVSASAITKSGVRIKQWRAFLEWCASFLPEARAQGLVTKLLEGQDYLLACEVLRRGLSDTWGELLHREFGQIADPSPLHGAIVGLDQRIMVTTNFDKLIESAIEQSGSTHYPKVVNKLSADAFKMLRDDGRYLVKMHGSIDDPETFIFTKSEYIAKAFENWIYGEFLRTLLATHTVLFVGFSMSDPAVSALVEQYAFRFPNGRPHYILQGGPIDQELIDINKSLRKLYAIEYDPKDDHIQLTEVIRFMYTEMMRRRLELAVDSSNLLKTG